MGICFCPSLSDLVSPFTILVLQHYSRTMSEESKTPEGNYVMMGPEGSMPGRNQMAVPLDDPDLSQEEKDRRLAIALQQQENAAALGDYQKKHEDYQRANTMRTARSGTYTKLAAVRQKDHGMLKVPAEYTSDHAYQGNDDGGYVAPFGGFVPPPKNATPQEIADYELAQNLQKFEQAGAGTVRTMEKISHEEAQEEEAQSRRTGYSTTHINQKGLFKHK